MLRNTFAHLPGIGPAKERRLWDQGIRDWTQLQRTAGEHFRGDRLNLMLEKLEAGERAYQERDLHFFYRAFPRDALWRVLTDVSLDDIAYLDIETTGMGMPPLCHSTTITVYFRGQVLQEYEHDQKRRMLERVLGECRLLCTFYGEVFDIPFLRQEFGLAFDKAHLDLCFWLKRHGYKGGLKKIQKLFPDIPSRLSLDIDGFDAVRLWRMHRQGVPGALETLLTYNAEDTVVLEPLLVKAFNLEVARHPEFGLRALEARPLPELATGSHAEVYAALRGT